MSQGADAAAGLSRAAARWGEAVVFALGLNVWISIILVPALFVGAFEHRATLLFLAAAPLVPLAVGATRRSPAWLLLVFPATLLPPIFADLRIVGANTHGPFTFSLVALGLLAYLFGVSYLTALAEPPPPERMRRLSSAAQPQPARWRRRVRIYAALTVLSAIFPPVLLYAVDFSRTNRAFLHGTYPGRVGSLTLLLNLGVLLLWLGLFATMFLGPLRKHRTGDRELLASLERARQQSRRGAPRAIFYLAVVGALVFMGLLIHLRYR